MEQGPRSLMESVCEMQNRAMKWILHDDGKFIEIFKDEGKGILEAVSKLALNGEIPDTRAALMNLCWKVFDLGQEFGGLYGFPK